MAKQIVERDDAAHGMTEENDRQPRMLGRNKPVDGIDIRDHFGDAVTRGESAKRGIVRLGVTVAAMVMGIGVETLLGHEFGEAPIARRMLGKPMVDLQHADRGRG